MHHSGVPVVNEDIGAALDGGNRRAGYHLQSHTVVTVHHTVNDLNLQSNSSYLSQTTNTENSRLNQRLFLLRIPGPSLRTSVSSTYTLAIAV